MSKCKPILQLAWTTLEGLSTKVIQTLLQSKHTGNSVCLTVLRYLDGTSRHSVNDTHHTSLGAAHRGLVTKTDTWNHLAVLSARPSGYREIWKECSEAMSVCVQSVCIYGKPLLPHPLGNGELNLKHITRILILLFGNGQHLSVLLYQSHAVEQNRFLPLSNSTVEIPIKILQ